MFRSATFQLTVWYMVIIIAISLAFSLVVYNVASNELAVGLAHQSQRFSVEYPAFSSNPLIRQSSELTNGTHQIVSNLILFNAVVFFLAGFASYGLARRTLQPIEIAHEQQKHFTADVSHELRTPLTALRMETEVSLMDKNASKSALRQALKSNLEEAAKLEQLISHLMRLTKLEAVEIQQQFSRLAITDVLNEALTTVRKTAKAKGITIAAEIQPGYVRGEATSLAQLFVILCDNAIKYSPAQSVIQVHSVTRKDTVVVDIADQGSGIEPGALQHVFNRFYRADKARTDSSTAGFGLGLSIAKYIADTHNGTITLSSRSGHGTTASVSLPIASSKA